VKPKVLYMHEQGPLIEYCAGVLTVQNLNPWVDTSWRFKRKDMLRLALRAFLTAIS
jgi:hypothetical protein